MPRKNPNIKGNIRKRGKRGETAREIIRLIVENPRMAIKEIADSVGCSNENVRVTLEKLKQKPETATLFGYDEEAIRSIIVYRNTKTAIKRETLWRGKANWPATKTATKKSVTNAELVRACGQHYTYQNGNQKYVIDPEYIGNKYSCDVEISINGEITRIVKGRPTIPISFKLWL
ncbi:MAG: hypothetical protein A4E52_00069 [Pelotomaculum sp. PtaB.Bin013]|uniref:AsnC family protein n=1 Tax=Pelotomaculum isophthalicicum JI TaxID=947010 RepID=A0A9X4H911_9FIRM|nr:AsnC family protein [Pelotomaculum isophthalicicum]MDF9409499.1 AsnC family protein [Pelotomaculum isophthalicicum JI]OPX92203.1 MAG: hypothetical protein A4E52_00069 [Pelotomaculum sp. PtaB.Bin013]